MEQIEKWRDYWGINENDEVWSPKYGYGEVVSEYEGGDAPILVSYEPAADGRRAGRYYSTNGVGEEEGDFIYPLEYAIVRDAVKRKDPTLYGANGGELLFLFLLFLFANMKDGRTHGSEVMKEPKHKMLKPKRNPEVAWKSLARTMQNSPCEAFFDFSSDDVLSDFLENISTICYAMADALESRYAGPGSEADGDSHTDV